MTTVCLCMLVKNEAAVIERCLTSVRSLIARWVICDTGSTDRTVELVRASLAGMPGELHERPWVDFGHNRTELMALAQGAADYLLLIDADMTVGYDIAKLDALDADSYMLRHEEDPEYWIKRLVSGSRSWRYIGATHEYITTDPPERTEYLSAIVIHHHADGGTRPDKFQRDLRLLTREHARNPQDPRTVFYLAQTLVGLGRLEEAIERYRQRVTMPGWEEETFYAQYQVGVLSAQIGNRSEAIDGLFSAWCRAPGRAEPLCLLASLFRERGEHQVAHLVAQRGLPIKMPAQGLFVERWVYEWGLLFEYSIAAYWAGRPRAALDACDRLLALPALPEPHRRQTIANREFCVSALRGRPAVTSTTHRPWRPEAAIPQSRRIHAVGAKGDGAQSERDTTVIEGGHRLRHRGTDADLDAIRRVFTERAYSLDPLRGHPGLGRYEDPTAIGGAPVIVDCGAHIGAASIWFALHHPGARVVALEPEPANFSLLRENAAGWPQVTPLRAAIAARAGAVPLSDPGRGSWEMRASADTALAGGGQVVEKVAAMTIDEVLESVGEAAPFILKVDIEGAEGDLFSSRWQVLARFPLVIVELHDWLLPGKGTSRSFLRWHVAHGRDLVPIGENLFSIAAADR